MYVRCAKCDRLYNDEHRSTLCPHEGIGYCVGCDCVICVCPPIPRYRLAEMIRFNAPTYTMPIVVDTDNSTLLSTERWYSYVVFPHG
jgi:hypothetical protein